MNYPQLTVFETLLFAAKLRFISFLLNFNLLVLSGFVSRLNENISSEKRKERVNLILAVLGLDAIRNSVVGSPGYRG